jgi:hypothetical protein
MSETTLVRQVRYGLIKARINHAGDIAAMVVQVKSQRYSSKVYSNDIVEYRENLAHMVILYIVTISFKIGNVYHRHDILPRYRYDEYFSTGSLLYSNNGMSLRSVYHDKNT